jgi:hypothetical protein
MAMVGFAHSFVHMGCSRQSKGQFPEVGFDTKLGRDVALKVLPDIFASDRERLARFTREAQCWLGSITFDLVVASAYKTITPRRA